MAIALSVSLQFHAFSIVKLFQIKSW